ncbi:MAG: thiolase C-terminal domain-containing protein [Acidimicrobiales bacterium]
MTSGPSVSRAATLGGRTAICGVGQSAYGRRMGRSNIDLAADALEGALQDAGLTPADLDGMVVSFGTPGGADADTLAFALGLDLRFYSQTWGHGRFTATCIQQAAMAVASGMADVVACMASVSFSGVSRPGRQRRGRGTAVGGDRDAEGAREAGGGHGEDPVVGMTSPGAGAALAAQRYFARFGASSEQLAAVPVAFRKGANLNPAAIMQTPLSVAEHQESRYVCEPLRLFDYCLVNDGATCVLVTSAERARDMAQTPIELAAMLPLPVSRKEFIWAWPGLGVAQQEDGQWQPGPRENGLYTAAGIDRADIDAFFTYDAFSFVVWPALERWGFCGMGEAAEFCQNGRIEIGGELPINTHGGLLSEAHVMAWNHQVEIVRQLRGQAGARQVPDARHIQWGNVYGDSILYRRAG